MNCLWVHLNNKLLDSAIFVSHQQHMFHKNLFLFCQSDCKNAGPYWLPYNSVSYRCRLAESQIYIILSFICGIYSWSVHLAAACHIFENGCSDTTSFKSVFCAICRPVIQINPLPYSHANSYGHCVFRLDQSYASMSFDGLHNWPIIYPTWDRSIRSART